MIQIVLTFTSLNAALRALREIPESTLNAALTDITPAEAPVVEAAALEAPAPRAKKPKPAPAPVTLPGVEEPIDYPTLQKEVLKLAGKNREAALALAGELGVKHFRDLPSERWAEALLAVTAKCSELEAMQ